MRLKNIHLANALKKLESTIRNKEQLAGELEIVQGPDASVVLLLAAGTHSCNTAGCGAVAGMVQCAAAVQQLLQP